MASSPAETSSELEPPAVDYGYQHDDPLTESERFAPRIPRRTNVTAEAAPYDISFRPGRMLLYSPPRQRQRWNDTQVLPRVNWGDLFFDLFYVAATYNVSNLVVVRPDRWGLLYAAGTFWCIMNIWNAKNFYDARFVTESDLYHRLASIVPLVVLALAVLHIRPVDILSDPANDPSIFVFCLMLVLDRVLWMIQTVELYFFGVGQKAVKKSSKRELLLHNICLPFYLAATIVAAREFWNDAEKSNDGVHRLLAENSTKVDAVYDSSSSSYGDNDGATDTMNNVPISLCIVGFIVASLVYGFNVIFCLPSDGSHKEVAVPLNIDFIIHRNGEWIMLMLGESIFSLLTVYLSKEKNSFHTVFYCGILTVIFLQMLHFQSQPHDPDSHASRRSKNAGVMWSWCQNIYSLALVLLGAAFTFFLTFSEVVSNVDGRRRSLAGSASAFTGEEIESAAHFFCGSLAVIFFLLEIMSFLHLGFKESRDRCDIKGGKNYAGILLVTLKVGVIVFTATLSQWETNPKTLTIIALCTVVLQLGMRKLCSKFLSHHDTAIHQAGTTDKPHQTDDPLSDNATGEAEWPNVTHARAEPAVEVELPP